MNYDWTNETGPRPENAQVWTPRPVVAILWNWMQRCGWIPGPTQRLADLAAGNGRLIEPVAGRVPLILNDLDPDLAAELVAKYPPPNIVYNEDFRVLGNELENVANAAVGAPPWMSDENDGSYLPQKYIEICERVLKSGGLCALVLPHWFTPTTAMRQIVTVQVDPRRLEGWPFPEKPVVHIYRKFGAPAPQRRIIQPTH